MPIQCIVLPRDPVYHRQIFALGIDYLPESAKIQIDHQKAILERAIENLPVENRQQVHQVFFGVVHYFELFIEAICLASQGKDPRQHSLHWHSLVSCSHKGIHELNLLKKNSPKTYQYLKQVEIKFLPYLQLFIEAVNRSTVDQFDISKPLPEEGIKFDRIVEQFKTAKYTHVPLAQAILQTDTLLEQYLLLFRNFYNDLYWQDSPELWPKRQTNISIGGIVVRVQQNYSPFEKVKVRLYFKQYNKLFEFEGSVVKVIPKKDGDDIAINFELPEAQQQDTLQQIIYRQEIEETMTIKLTD